MAKVQIVTDSISNLSQEEIEKYNIKIVHLNVLVDGVSYSDKDVSKETFLDLLNNAKELPKTSQPSLGHFLEVYDSFEEGTEIVSLHVASALSGTSSAAQQAGDMSKNSVTVIDTTFADRGQAFQVIEAAKLAQNGASVDEIVSYCEKVKDNTTLYLCVMSLDNLVKGGRVSKAKGLLSNLLNIKVIFEFKDGILTPLQKGRGVKSIEKFLHDIALPKIKEKVQKECSISFVSTTKLIDDTIEKIKEMTQIQDMHFGFTIPTVAIHTGEGAFALMHYHD
ncbi:DegV family protein [Carnobacteriaceae bacterium zg-ZUI252]|nr:DegV family protein [Carnobacteriaceae bacterium zg-ZUI252]MBS4769921.1 DegV family protein [Carnobacteriaceae bacterium zg-ZUI240]QTU83330.1 DegV family protein [Carnobacteriaceae bacterium zg-C25]